MDRLKRNVFAKAAAIVLSYFSVASLVISVISVGVMVYFDFYTRDKALLEKSIMENYSKSETNKALTLYLDGMIDEYYSDKNIHVSIKCNGEIVYSSKSEQEYISSATKTVYLYIDKNNITHFAQHSVYIENSGYSQYDSYEITICIPRKMQFTDRFFAINRAINVGYSMRITMIFIALISLAVSVTVLCFAFSAAGYRKNYNTLKLNLIDRIPYDIYCLINAFTAIFAAQVIYEIIGTSVFALLAVLFIISVLYFVGLGFMLSTATRIKTQTLIKSCVIYNALKFLLKYLKKILKFLRYLFSKVNTIWKTVLIISGASIIELIFLLPNIWQPDNIMTIWTIRTAILSTAAVLFAISFKRIKSGGEKIASGDLEYKINTEYLYGDFKEFSKSLNNISEGMQAAVNDKMRSERLKTELITNVSHDIKTPLTSIINYVDLIKKQQPENESIKEYLNVLERQSIRLKKLVEDLVEASKASTGNLHVELAPADAAVLLTQTAGEYDERLRASKLEMVLNVPETPVIIYADGRRLWRVFDNLMNNICKYAMPSTRVYIDLVYMENTVQIIFRNISKFPLKISQDELTERFVRGDASRNTEGSGLGLSIAKSLVELQGGDIQIFTDGDLFKAVITFNTIQEEVK